MAKAERIYAWVSSSTGTPTITSTTSSTTAGSFHVTSSPSQRHDLSLDDIEKAVFAHIQAVRTLGRNEINTDEISQALSIPQAYVVAAIARLRGKGVRVVG